MTHNELKPSIQPLQWEGGVLRLLDQRLLPHKEVWLEIVSLEQLTDAIRGLAVRGAPLLGITAAYGVLIGMSESNADDEREFIKAYEHSRDAIAATRPTARNLFGALEQMDKVVESNIALGQERLLAAILNEAQAIHREEIKSCEAMASNGAPLLKSVRKVVTHCNTGALATGGVGTALGVIVAAHKSYGLETVWVDETRPLLQGARLTAWELDRLGIPYRIICDSAAASIIARGEADAAITGADRIAANGDTANKIGTLALAITCKHYGIPFYIAAPTSTIDLSIPSGDGIIIEMRDDDEIHGWRDCTWASEDSPTLNPAFDVTPAELISAIITERGVIQKPNEASIERHFA